MSSEAPQPGSGLATQAAHLRHRFWWYGQRLRQLRRSMTVEYLQGQGPLDLNALISPLRYDVVVREEFIRSVRSDWALYQRDFEALMAFALTSEYFFWFRSVAVQHVGVPAQDPEALHRAFRRRVRRTLLLIEAFDRNGFDPKFPLVVRAATSVPTSTGKHLAARFYPLDGCHRLALLRLAGLDELPAPYYRLVATSLPPLDNTLPLIRALHLDPARYYRYLAAGYGVPPASTRDQLLQELARSRPEAVAELEHVLAVDEPALLVPGGPTVLGVPGS